MTSAATEQFFGLTADTVLEAVEASGLYCKPVCFPLNSYENRVYLMELDDDKRLVSKFYRPGRWTREQILEEHQFIADLAEAEIPVCRTLPFPDGETVKEIKGIYYCLFDRYGGRAPAELTDDDVERLGMLVGRMHNVAAARPTEHRISLTADTYIWDNVTYLEDNNCLPPQLASRYLDAATYVAGRADEYLKGVEVHRVHGDLHLGNLLQRDGVFNVLDFDDMVIGPAVQDMWLMIPGRDQYSMRQRESFLEGYSRFRSFDRKTLRLVEPLRGLRMIHYATWLARRWADPIFPKTWPHFGTENYWREETEALEDLVQFIKTDRGEGAELAQAESLTNKDYFYDWED